MQGSHARLKDSQTSIITTDLLSKRLKNRLTISKQRANHKTAAWVANVYMQRHTEQVRLRARADPGNTCLLKNWSLVSQIYGGSMLPGECTALTSVKTTQKW